MEVMHAGFVLWFIDFVVEHIGVFVWILINAIIIKVLYTKTYINRFFIVILSVALSIIILRLISREWFEGFVSFISGRG